MPILRFSKPYSPMPTRSNRSSIGARSASVTTLYCNSDANYIKTLTDRRPEYHSLVTRVLKLYSEITEKALENEQKAAK